MAANKFFIDSNVFLRFLTADHEDQFQKASEIFEQIAEGGLDVYFNSLVVHEVIFVLEHVYSVPRSQIVKGFSELLKLTNLIFLDAEKDVLQDSLTDYNRTGLDFPDCLFANLAKGAGMKMLTFDKDFRRLDIETRP